MQSLAQTCKQRGVGDLKRPGCGMNVAAMKRQRAAGVSVASFFQGANGSDVFGKNVIGSAGSVAISREPGRRSSSITSARAVHQHFDVSSAFLALGGLPLSHSLCPHDGGTPAPRDFLRCLLPMM